MPLAAYARLLKTVWSIYPLILSYQRTNNPEGRTRILSCLSGDGCRDKAGLEKKLKTPCIQITRY